MKIYDTSYGPDTFGRIRMGLITEMFLIYEGYLCPEEGDQLRISCTFKGVVRDIYIVKILEVRPCVDEPETVLIRVGALQLANLKEKNYNVNCSRDLNPTLH